jgi:SNF2 family DNA or RNA helicase
MRVGKTAQAILAAHKIGADNILVVCPAIACTHWVREFRKWWPGSILPQAVVQSYDKAKINSEYLLAQRWDIVIVDECHFAKNPEAQRTKLIYGKDGLGWHTERMWALSGTPAPKHAGELWPMLAAFGITNLSYAEFTRRYCTIDSWTLRITGTKERMIPELRALLFTVMLRRKRSEVAPDMPDIDFQFLEVQPVSQADLHGTPTGLNDEQLLDWVQRHPTADREDRIAVAQAKALPLVENICFNLENDLLKQTVVFGWHIEPLAAVVAGLRQRGLSVDLLNGSTPQRQRAEIQDAFRQGKLQVVVANILAAGTAIDLSAARHAYFLELDWVPGNNLQAANRLISMEKSDKVTVDVVTWPGSVDDRVQRVLLQRAQQLGKLY